MSTKRERDALSRKITLIAFGILIIGLVLLFSLPATTPAAVRNLLIPGIPIVFIGLTFAALWLKVPHKHKD